MLNKAKIELGPKIKAVRERRDLTVEELARQAGVSKGLVSQIERGLVSPSIDTLVSLADCLEVDMDYLFSGSRRSKQAMVIRKGGHRRLERDGVTYERLSVVSDPEEKYAFEAFLLTIAAGGEKGSQDFGHAGKEFGLLLSGRALLDYGRNSYKLAAGDSVLFDADMPHTLKNAGKGELKAFWIATPPKTSYF